MFFETQVSDLFAQFTKITFRDEETDHGVAREGTTHTTEQSRIGWWMIECPITSYKGSNDLCNISY